MKLNIFSLNLTGDIDFLILFISTQYKRSMNGFKLDLNDQIFCYRELFGSKIFIFIHFYVDARANIQPLHIFIDLKTVFI